MSENENGSAYLFIREPGGKERRIPLGSNSLTIGREPGNDLVLNDPKISRHHSRIEFDGVNYLVRDLRSKNGTYLGNVRLEPDQPEIWRPESRLRLGGTWLSLVLSRKTPSLPKETFMGTGATQTAPVEKTRQSPRYSASQVALQGKISLTIEQPRLSVIPGSTAATTIIIHHSAPEEDTYRVSVQGIPAEWLSSLPPSVRMFPRSQHTFHLSVSPLRRPQSKAGRYPIKVRVTSLRDPGVFAEADVILTVAAYSQVESKLENLQVEPGESIVIKASNLGNAPDTVNLTWDGDGIIFTPPQIKQKIPSGQSIMVETRGELARRRWIGGEMSYPFTTYVSSASGQAETHSATMVSTGMVPIWFPPVAVILFLTLVGGFALLALLISQFQGMQDAVAVGKLQTQTAEVISRTTMEAATATAVWIIQDGDRDGLTNAQEQLFGTLPDQADTDSDGLADGLEISRSTSPIKPDSDDDGWMDGFEVRQGTNPLNQDTDMDGIPDAQDPDPRQAQAPTFTPTFQVTAATNTAPVNTIPGAQTTLEDTALIFSGSTGNQVYVNDAEAAGNPVKVTLNGINGMMSLNGNLGLVFQNGDGKDDNTMTFSASLSALNVALNGFKFSPNGDYFGSAGIQVITDDQASSSVGGAKSDTDTIVINVVAVNDAPSFSEGPDITVDEDAGPVVSEIWAKSISPGPANESSQKISFRIATSNDGLFSQLPAIEPSNGKLAFRPAPNANGSAVVTVQLQDDGGTNNGGTDTSQPQAFAILVNPTPDNPTNLTLSNTGVRENAGNNVLVGKFSTTDPDTGDNHTFHLVAGEGSADNWAFTIVGNELRANQSFDYETKNNLSIRVRTTDSSGRFLEHQFTISVANENEAPVAFDDSAAATGGAPVVVDVLANDIDPDGNRLAVIQVSSPTTGTAAIVENRIMYTPTVDFSGVVFTYTVSDGSLTDTAQVTINQTQPTDSTRIPQLWWRVVQTIPGGWRPGSRQPGFPLEQPLRSIYFSYQESVRYRFPR